MAGRTPSFLMSYPKDLLEACVDALRCIGDRLQEDTFLSTYQLDLQDVKSTLASLSIIVSVTKPLAYNASVAALEAGRPAGTSSYLIDDEYGWFDPRVSKTTVHVNHKYYEDLSPSADEHLPKLIFTTVAHEYAQLLNHHLKKQSPAQPFASLKPPVTESGDYWEYATLGGRLVIAAHPTTRLRVEALYLLCLDDQKKEKIVFMSFDQGIKFKLFMQGLVSQMPEINLKTPDRGDPSWAKYKLACKNLETVTDEDNNIEPSCPVLLPVPQPRKGDKKG